MALDILIVDDESDIRELVAGVLEDDGYEARCAADSDAALAAIADRRPSLVFQAMATLTLQLRRCAGALQILSKSRLKQSACFT